MCLNGNIILQNWETLGAKPLKGIVSNHTTQVCIQSSEITLITSPRCSNCNRETWIHFYKNVTEYAPNKKPFYQRQLATHVRLWEHLLLGSLTWEKHKNLERSLMINMLHKGKRMKEGFLENNRKRRMIIIVPTFSGSMFHSLHSIIWSEEEGKHNPLVAAAVYAPKSTWASSRSGGRCHFSPHELTEEIKKDV